MKTSSPSLSTPSASFLIIFLINIISPISPLTTDSIATNSIATDSLATTVSNETNHDDEYHGDVHHHHWNYDEQQEWSVEYQSCSGNRQSPIDISSQDVVFDEKLMNIEFVGNLNTNASVVNNGHTVNLEPWNHIRLVGGSLNDDFRVQGIHFHWGANREGGSEHTFNNKHYAMEMHIVTYKESGYLNFQHAAQGNDSLAVYGVLFEQTREENPYLKPLLSVLKQVQNSKKSVPTKGPINLAKLLPSDYSNKYLRYPGSLTTPPCTENVIWTVALGTSSISEGQINEFRQLREIDPDSQETEADSKFGNQKIEPPELTHNWREGQKLNGRKIRSTVAKIPEKSENLNIVGNGGCKGKDLNQVVGLLVCWIVVLVRLKIW